MALRRTRRLVAAGATLAALAAIPATASADVRGPDSTLAFGGGTAVLVFKNGNGPNGCTLADSNGNIYSGTCMYDDHGNVSGVIV